MLNALFLSLRQLLDKRILALLLKVLLLTLLLLTVLGAGLFFGLQAAFAYVLPADGGFAAAAAAAILGILAALFLFRVVAIFALNIFSDDVVDAVEIRHYPARAERAKPPSYALGLRMGLRSAGRAIAYNLLAAPVYIMLLVTAIGPAIAFFVVNAILIGRDLQDMVAARHVNEPREIEGQWDLPKAKRFVLGLVTALLMAIPFVNFLAPILGAAMATHLVHQRDEKGRST